MVGERYMFGHKKKKTKYPSLYDVFNLGDRVKRVMVDGVGNHREYKGIVLAIEEKSMEIYWDTKDGEYRPGEIDLAFTNCAVDEIFDGKEHSSPIKRDD